MGRLAPAALMRHLGRNPRIPKPELPMRPDIAALSDSIETSVSLLRRRL